MKTCDLSALKKTTDLVALVQARGVALQKRGADYVGLCPFHQEQTPSFHVTPGKNLFHCFGCGAAGSAIDLVMKLDGLDFRQAVNQLLIGHGGIQRGSDLVPPVATASAPPLGEEKVQQLLEKVIGVYEKTFPDVAEGRDYLQKRALADAGLLARHRIGYCNGRLKEILPKTGPVWDELKQAGVLLKNGQERFAGCVTVPVFDVDGNIVTLYGRFSGEGTKRHVYLAGRPTGLWNVGIIKTHAEIILVESVIDALSVEATGYANVVSIQSTNGFSDTDRQLFQDFGVRKLILLLDGDEPGQTAAERLKEKASSFSCQVLRLPGGHDPNSFLVEHGAEKLARFIAENTVNAPAESAGSAPQSRGSDAARSLPDGFAVSYGLRRYEVRGLEKGSRKLRATIRVEHAGKLHVDTLDLYSARCRRILEQDLCRLFDEPPESIEADLARLVVACEQRPEPPPAEAPVAPVIQVPAAERPEAEAFGQAPDILENILTDYETCGLVGEKANKLLCYLAAVSRKMEQPLSVMLLSSSGAGKTVLQDAALAFVPPEDLVKLTSLTGRALFYKEQLSLKHKVLSLEEGAGAEEATYAIRNLISAGELIIESAIKDPMTGRLTTMVNRVEGPTSVFITTTDPETDPETRTRFFVSSIDESREQTRAILVFQRQRQTLAGLCGNLAVDAVLRKHRNFQRLLRPLAVVNPFAQQLRYGDDRLQGRRDQPKYLNLIKAVAFLRQMRKDIRTARRKNGEPFEYIEADLDDLRSANALATEILGHSLDELTRPSRDLLMLLDEMVAAKAKPTAKENKPTTGGNGDTEHNASRPSLSFTRREIRERTGWANARVHRYLKELVDLEYVLLDTGRNGCTCRYRLAYDGQGKDGQRFLLGLKPVEELRPPPRSPDR